LDKNGIIYQQIQMRFNCFINNKIKYLSRNPNAIKLLKENPDKIDWFILSGNLGIFQK
jgi:hypothetical protein